MLLQIKIIFWSRVWALICMVIIGGGCRFWVSSAPDFSHDKWRELVVIWDRHGGTKLIQTAWSTTNRLVLDDLSEKLDTKTWQSLSICARSHPTRIIAVTESGKRWEIHLVRPNLSVFCIDDQGVSGLISNSAGFVQSLSLVIERDVGEEVDLAHDYSNAVYKEEIKRFIPEATREQMKRFYVPIR